MPALLRPRHGRSDLPKTRPRRARPLREAPGPPPDRRDMPSGRELHVYSLLCLVDCCCFDLFVLIYCMLFVVALLVLGGGRHGVRSRPARVPGCPRPAPAAPCRRSPSLRARARRDRERDVSVTALQPLPFRRHNFG